MSHQWAVRGLAAVAIVGALALSGCSAGAAPDATPESVSAAPVDGGRLTVGLDREVPSLDPAAGAIGQQPLFVFANAVYEPLMKPAPGGAVEPGLASSLVSDVTGAEWTLTLPDDLTFSDGSPLTAESVRLYLAHLADPAAGSAAIGQASQIAEMRTEGTTTLVMTLALPNADFDGQFARALGMIASTTATDAFGFPLGAGPYRVDKFVPGDSVTVVRSDNYAGAETPHLDEIVFTMMPDAETRLQSLQAGDIDIMWTEVTSQFQQARGDGNLAVHAVPAAVSSIVLNLQNPKFADLEIRTALARAIDRDAVNAVVNLGEGTLVDSPYALLGDLAPQVDYPAYDLDAARAVLEKAGLSFELSVNNRTETIQRATVLKDMLAAVGVEVSIKPVEPATFGTMLSTHDFEAVDFVTSLYADASGGRLSARSGSPYNFSGFADADVDAALDAASATTDPSRRAAELKTVAQTLVTDLPVLWLTASNAGFIGRSDVAGFPDLTGMTLVSVQPAQLGWTEAQR